MAGNGSFILLLVASPQRNALAPNEEDLLTLLLEQGYQWVELHVLLHELRSDKAAAGPRLFVCVMSFEESLAKLDILGAEVASLNVVGAPPHDFNSRRFWQRFVELLATQATQTPVHGPTPNSRALTTDLRRRELS